EEALKREKRISKALFQGEVRQLSAEEIKEGIRDVPSTTVSDSHFPLVDFLMQVGAAQSKREAREFIRNGAISVNDERQTDPQIQIDRIEKIDGRFLVIRRGKKNVFLCEVQ